MNSKESRFLGKMPKDSKFRVVISCVPDRELNNLLVRLLRNLQVTLAVPQVAHVGGGVSQGADVQEVAVEEGLPTNMSD